MGVSEQRDPDDQARTVGSVTVRPGPRGTMIEDVLDNRGRRFLVAIER